MEVANTIAYCDTATITTVKIYSTGPRGQIYKEFNEDSLGRGMLS
jgi:hypothetical protein